MARAIDLTSKEWLDLVFANKNQAYGAYEIRKTSSKRHLMSLGIVILLGVTLSALPMVMKKLFPARSSTDDAVGKITMVDYKLPEKDKEIITPVKQVEPVLDLKKTIRFLPPVIKPDPEVTETEDMPTQALLSNTDATISIITNEGVKGGTIDPADLVDKTGGNNSTETETAFVHVEQMPYFPGGEKEMMSYLSRNIKYPVPSQETGTQGSVVLRFVVGKDGNIRDVTILRSLDPNCDKEAIRVVKSMPQWTPGRQNGNPVAVYYTLPVRFKLNN